MCPLFLAFDQLGAHATCLIKSYLMHIPNAELNISQQLFLFYFTGIHLCLQSYAAVDALYSLVYLSVNEASTLTPRLLPGRAATCRKHVLRCRYTYCR